ncbi:MULTISPECIES: hypothetical protein [Gordonia]|uniref:hypothetical protein n=1 Tax=Gordonia TaxID=2053 RepID=UPI003263B832
MTDPTAEFGYTRWGRDFLRIAEPTDVTRPEPLLPRARSLARNAMTDVQVDGRLIRGTVVRGGEASVAYLEFAPMSRQSARAVADVVGSAPGPAALTDDVHSRVADSSPELAVVDCSCRARTPRCVHVLALLYETVRRVDEDPRTALTLRGFHDALDGPADDGDVIERWTPLTALDPQSFYDA